MAYGPVNVPGVTHAELETVKSTAEKALAAADKTEGVLKELGIIPDSVLANNSPELIQKVAALGLGENFWSVGDCYPIKVNQFKLGTNININGTYNAFIIGFNHNESIEGKGIHFQFGKTNDGKNIAFVDSIYGSSAPTPMIPALSFWWGVDGDEGWYGSHMCSEVCPNFKKALPKEWQDIISSCTKYTAGDLQATQNGYVKDNQEEIFLLAEYEIFGARTRASINEQTYQKQYAYYANGNNKIHYKHNSQSTACIVLTRSACVASSGWGDGNCCAISATGTNVAVDDTISYGFAPAFKVG